MKQAYLLGVIVVLMGCKPEMRVCPVCQGKGTVSPREYARLTGADPNQIERVVYSDPACPRCGGSKTINEKFLTDSEELQTRPGGGNDPLFKPEGRK